MMKVEYLSDCESEEPHSDNEFTSAKIHDTKVKQVCMKLPLLDSFKTQKRGVRDFDLLNTPTGLKESCDPKPPAARCINDLELCLKNAKFNFANTDSRLIESDSSETEDSEEPTFYSNLAGFKLQKGLALK